MKTSSSIRSYVVNLNDYQQIHEINRGGYGIVYLVESKKDHRQYAAKVNIQGVKSISEQEKAISRELSILIRVQAPNITSFLYINMYIYTQISFLAFSGDFNIKSKALRRCNHE